MTPEQRDQSQVAFKFTNWKSIKIPEEFVYPKSEGVYEGNCYTSNYYTPYLAKTSSVEVDYTKSVGDLLSRSGVRVGHYQADTWETPMEDGEEETVKAALKRHDLEYIRQDLTKRLVFVPLLFGRTHFGSLERTYLRGAGLLAAIDFARTNSLGYRPATIEEFIQWGLKEAKEESARPFLGFSLPCGISTVGFLYHATRHNPEVYRKSGSSEVYAPNLKCDGCTKTPKGALRLESLGVNARGYPSSAVLFVKE
jgi:hypothetical protein